MSSFSRNLSYKYVQGRHDLRCARTNLTLSDSIVLQAKNNDTYFLGNDEDAQIMNGTRQAAP